MNFEATFILSDTETTLCFLLPCR